MQTICKGGLLVQIYYTHHFKRGYPITYGTAPVNKKTLLLYSLDYRAPPQYGSGLILASTLAFSFLSARL